jgi:hypothetical protein
VGAADPVALSAVAALTLAAVLLASYVPARREMRVSPGLALRTD